MSDEKNISLVNFGDLSKPATVLIEKISEAVGGCFRPYQIKRVAKAEAEAEIIKAQAQIEISELQHRALTRFVAEEAQKQHNIEEITRKAIPQLSNDPKPEEMDNDWIANFFDKCRIISDDEMQSLWAKVLAGEASTPGVFSKRTVNFLSSIDKTDARLFTNLCRFNWLVGSVVPLIYDFDAPIYNTNGINFGVLTHLDAIGLINFNSLSGFERKEVPKRFPVIYFGTTLLIEFDQDKNRLPIGKGLLTQTGLELAKICGAKPIDGFLDYVIAKWKAEGLKTIVLKHSNFSQPSSP